MLSRFDDTEIMEQDVILTSKRSYQRELLIKQLIQSEELGSAGFDFENSAYFRKYITMMGN